MSIQFSNFRKVLTNEKSLDLSFFLEKNQTLSIVDDNIETLDIIKRSLYKNEDYQGDILVDSINIKERKNIFFSQENVGLYSNFSLYENFKYLLSLYSKKIKRSDLLSYFEDLSLDYKLKFSKLTSLEKEKVYLLLSYLLSTDLFLIDLTKEEFFKEEVLVAKFLENVIKKADKTIIIFSNKLNLISSLSQKVLIISDEKQVYFGDKKDLDVIQELVVLKLSELNEEVFKERFVFNFTIVNDKIILEKDNLEAALYYFVSNNIEVLSMSTFDESTDLYEKGE